MPPLEALPELTPWQQYVLDCFDLLRRDRSIGMTVGPIPYAAIDRFIDSRLRRGWMDDDEAEAFEAILTRLDDHDLAALHSKGGDGEAEPDADGKGKNKPRRPKPPSRRPPA